MTKPREKTREELTARVRVPAESERVPHVNVRRMGGSPLGKERRVLEIPDAAVPRNVDVPPQPREVKCPRAVRVLRNPAQLHIHPFRTDRGVEGRRERGQE